MGVAHSLEKALWGEVEPTISIRLTSGGPGKRLILAVRFPY